jgi:hypothetical protein
MDNEEEGEEEEENEVVNKEVPANNIRTENSASSNNLETWGMGLGSCAQLIRLAAYDIVDLPLLANSDNNIKGITAEVKSNKVPRLHSSPLSQLCAAIEYTTTTAKKVKKRDSKKVKMNRKMRAIVYGSDQGSNDSGDGSGSGVQTVRIPVTTNTHFSDHILLLLGDRFLRAMDSKGGLIAAGFGRKEVIEGDGGDTMVYY